MISALSAARYFVYLSYDQNNYSLTHLKLQKLLYMAQGWSYVWDDKPLFPEDFEAWQYGPVCLDVYHHFKKYGKEEIPECEAISEVDEQDAQETVASVWENWGKYNAYELVELTHQQKPWQNAYRTHQTICKQDIKDYYQSTY